MTLEDDIRNLSQLPIFAELDLEALRLIAFSAETKILRAGDILFKPGDTADGGYIVLSGSIALSRDADIGPTEQIVSRGMLIGEVALLTETERATAAIAREPVTLLKVSRALFHRVLQEYPGSAARLRTMIARRVAQFTSELDDMRTRSFNG